MYENVRVKYNRVKPPGNTAPILPWRGPTVTTAKSYTYVHEQN